jgi:hypothetical protein
LAAVFFAPTAFFATGFFAVAFFAVVFSTATRFAFFVAVFFLGFVTMIIAPSECFVMLRSEATKHLWTNSVRARDPSRLCRSG